MNAVLKIFLSMSFSGSLLILALLFGKQFLKNKISRQWQYYIWLIVLLRLLLPFGPEVSLMGKAYQAVDQAISQTAPLPPQHVTVVGSWIMPIEGQPGEMQGIKLEENGEASSINMHTLIYKEWEQQGDYLYLTVKSIGNGIEIEGVDTLKIDKLTADSLVLISNYGYTLEYVKQK